MSNVLKNLAIDGLKHLASYDYQKVAWFASSRPVVSSFVEDVCMLFDDAGLSRAFKNNEAAFGETVDRALRDLNAAIDNVSWKRSPAEIIDDPYMKIVREKAAQVLRLIEASR